MSLLRRTNWPAVKRLFSSINMGKNYTLEHLKNRGLVRVSGTQVSDFLQGLITNDIEHLSSGPGSMYTMFLNTKGRVLYDTIIYRSTEENSYLIECDIQIIDNLQKHLKMYRVRRKIDIVPLVDQLNVYSLFDTEDCHGNVDVARIEQFKAHHDLQIFRDPRVSSLGHRIVSKSSSNIHDQLKSLANVVEQDGSKNYRWLRYSLGVSEGIDELPMEKCFPLEYNCDYLHGVSFHKGCYVGQELTARVHHTGVVRKRIMPLFFTKQPIDLKLPDDNIMHENNNLGKIRGVEQDVGLGLLRIDKVLAYEHFMVGNGVAHTKKPNWWPIEVTKEKANLNVKKNY